MKQLGIAPTLGENVLLADAKLGPYTDIGPESQILESKLGAYTYCAGYNQIAYADIGPFVSIATGVRVGPGNHPTYTRVAQHHFTYRAAQFGLGEDDETFFNWRRAHRVTVGHDVWIGHNAVIMPGVSISSGAVIGSAAVVTHDVGAYEVAVGVPARVIRRRFPTGVAEAIERTHWWEWPHDLLRERLPEFSDIERFLEKYAGGNP